MSRQIRLLPLAAALVPIAAATAIAAGAAGVTPALLSCGGARLVRPSGTVVLTCADANAQISRTHWSSWTATGAAGTTEFDVDLCTPTCVASPMRRIGGARIELRDPKRTSHGVLFTRAVVRYTLHGRAHTFTAHPRT